MTPSTALQNIKCLALCCLDTDGGHFQQLPWCHHISSKERVKNSLNIFIDVKVIKEYSGRFGVGPPLFCLNKWIATLFFFLWDFCLLAYVWFAFSFLTDIFWIILYIYMYNTEHCLLSILLNIQNSVCLTCPFSFTLYFRIDYWENLHNDIPASFFMPNKNALNQKFY